MGGDGVAAGGRVGSVDMRGRVFPGDLTSVGAPGIRDGMLGIEVAGSDRGSDGLAHQHFAGLHGTTGDRRYRRCATPAEYKSSAQADAFERGTPEIGKLRGGKIGAVVPRPDVVGFKPTPCQPFADF